MRISFTPRRKFGTWPLAIKTFAVVVFLLVFWTLLNDHAFLTRTLQAVYLPGDPARVIRPADSGLLVRTADPERRWSLSGSAFPFTVVTPFASRSVRVQAKLSPATATSITLTAAGADHLGTLSVLAYSRFLNGLDWDHVGAGGLTLWQRPRGQHAPVSNARQYSSVNEFFSSRPDPNTVATAGLDRMALSTIRDYRPATSSMTIQQTLRGSMQFYVYAAHETLSINFDAVALNRVKGKNSLVVRVGKSDQLTSSRRSWLSVVTVGDDGITNGKNIIGPAQPVSISLPNVEPGYYLVDIVTSDDTVVQHLTSRQHVLAFSSRIVLADGPAYGAQNRYVPASIRTSGPDLSLAPAHSQGIQTIRVDGVARRLSQVRVYTTLGHLSPSAIVDIPQDDVMVSSTGLIAIQPAQLPQDGGMRPLEIDSEPNLDGVQYIIAPYGIPESRRDLVADYTFDGTMLQLSKANQYSFSLIVVGGPIGLKDIHVQLIRGAYPSSLVWEKFLHALRKL